MKKVFKWIGIVLGVIVLILLIVAAWIQFTPMPSFEVAPVAVQLPVDSLSLARGKKLVEASCVHCHMGEDGKMSGRLFTPATDPFGEMWTSNITQHPTKGMMGLYTDSELAYLIRTGVNREGRWVGGMMTRSNLSDDDLACLIAYLRSDAGIMQASEAEHPLPAYLDMFIVKALAKFGVFKPTPFDGKPRVAPPSSDQLAYGRYLAHEVYECYTCHSATFETNDPVSPEKSVNYFGGGNKVPDDEFNEVVSPNLTPSKAYGLGNWTAEQFHTAVRMGVRPDGTQLKRQMPRYAALEDAEIAAIWAYLQTVPAIESDPSAIAKK
ncbi:MAG: c-type cytochrome [Saprospiraceae bacterium]